MATSASTVKSGATLGRRLMAEALGTAYLLAAVVGSGVMAEWGRSSSPSSAGAATATVLFQWLLRDSVDWPA